MDFEYIPSKVNYEDIMVLYEMIPYSSPYVQKANIISENKINVTCSEDKKNEVIKKILQMEELIVKTINSSKEIPVKTIMDFTSKTTIISSGIFDEMIKQDMIKEIAPGAFAYSGLFLKIFKYFEMKIDEFGNVKFPKMKKYEFPVLYPVDEYEKGRYFESFPHYIMFQTTMKNDVDTLNKFAENGIKNKEIFKEMARPHNVLRHAACAPLYSLIGNNQTMINQLTTYNVSGKCFRNEASNIFELARLNEFYMKEFVFVGTQDECRESVELSKELWIFWIDAFSINCKIDTANDSFFASNYKKLKLFQILGDSKQELKCLLPSSNIYSACSSINFHRTHFSKPYDIRKDKDTFCYTACFAFGIERLAYALLCQKGLDINKWDKNTYTEINKYVSL